MTDATQFHPFEGGLHIEASVFVRVNWGVILRGHVAHLVFRALHSSRSAVLLHLVTDHAHLAVAAARSVEFDVIESPVLGSLPDDFCSNVV